MSFGELDPSSRSNSPITTSVTVTLDCSGRDAQRSLQLRPLNGVSTTRGFGALKHTTLPSALIRYEFAVLGNPTRGPSWTRTISATVVPSAYAAAPAGEYSEPLTLELN